MSAKRKISISSAYLYSMLLITALSILVVGYLWLSYISDKFEDESEALREEYIERHESMVKNEVEKVIDFIRYKKSQTEQRLKSDIKCRAYEAHDISMNIYKENKRSKSDTEIQKMITDALRPIRFNNGRGYYFITGLDGIEQLFADHPELEGKNLIGMQDTKGKFVIKDMIQIVKDQSEGFYEYTWTKPNEKEKNFPKIAFIKHFEPFDWFVGTGEYLDDVERDIQKEVLERIEKVRFHNDGYIFAGRYDGLELSGPAKGKNMYEVTDANGVKIVQELIDSAKRGGGFVRYVMPKFEGKKSAPKTSYVKAIMDWEWYVGAGLYIDEIDAVIAQREIELLQDVKYQVLKVLFTLIALFFVTILLTKYTSSKSEKSFKVFLSFFEKAADESVTINLDDVYFEEFSKLANSANKMVDDRSSAETALKKSEEKYRLLIFNLPGIAYKGYKDGSVEFFDKKIEQFIGYDMDEFNSRRMKWIDIVEKEDIDHVKERFVEALKTDKSYVREYSIRSKSGEIRWIQERGHIICDKKGEIEYISGAFFDITDHRLAEEALKKSEITLESIFRAAPTGIGVVRNRVIIQANERLCEITGYSCEELSGKNAKMLYPTDEDFEYVGREKYRQIGKHGTGSVETRWQRKDGEVIDIILSSTPIDPNDWSKGVTFTALDISDRKKADRLLKESEKKFRTLANFTYDWEGWIGTDMTHTYVSPSCERITGYRQDEFMRKPDLLEKIVHPKDRGGFARHLHQELAHDQVGQEEFRIITRSGDLRWIEHVCHYVTDEDGEWMGRRYCNRDISERKKLQSRLSHMQKMESIGTLAGGIAHDFNNILSPIILHTEMMLGDFSEDNPLRFNLKEVLDASNRARDLVKQILTFSRQTEEEKAPLIIGPIVKEALKLLRSSLPSTIEIRQHIASESGAVLADPTQVHQILMNLCTNAAHAMQESGGLLEVSLLDVEITSEETTLIPDLKPGPYVKLTVRDTGSGMEKDVKERIFEPYFSTKKRDEGTGLGLAVVHGIVSSYGGAISVESEPGKGSVFHVFFSKVKGHTAQQQFNALQFLGGTEKILLIDDDKSMLLAMQQMLSRLGYRVDARKSGIEALEVFRKYPDGFDLIITDFTMPEMTGADLAREIMEVRSEIPIILCTGFSERIDEERSAAIGIRAFLMKPIIVSELADTIRRVLDDDK